MRNRNCLFLVPALLFVASCSHQDITAGEVARVVAIQPLGNDLAYVQSTGIVQRLNVVSSNPNPSTAKTPIVHQPRIVIKRPNPSGKSSKDELLIVSDGTKNEYGEVTEGPALTALDAAGDKRVYALKDPGQQLRVSDDGSFAILFQDPDHSDSTSLLTNVGEVAIIDLNQEPADQKDPIIRTIDTIGGAPISVLYPTLTLDSRDTTRPVRNYAFFVFPSGVSLIDLANPTEPGHKLDLTGWLPSNGTTTSSSLTMAADPTWNELYLTTTSSDFVETITVLPNADDSDVNVSLKQLTVGSVPPGAIDAYVVDADTPSPRPQLVATLDTKVALVATDEDAVTTATLTYSANRMLRFQSTSPSDPSIKQRALLYSTGNSSARAPQTAVTFVDLENMTKDPQRSLEVVNFGQTISELRQVDFLTDKVLVFFSDGGVDILDLASRRRAPISSPVPLTIVVADQGREQVWVSAPGDHRIASLDFSTLASQGTFTVTSTVQLDDPVQQLFRVDDGSGQQKVVIAHDQVGGAVTILNAANPQRSTAKKLEGFLFSNLMD